MKCNMGKQQLNILYKKIIKIATIQTIENNFPNECIISKKCNR